MDFTEVKRNDMESDLCYVKRKAYALQYMLPRMEVNEGAVPAKMNNAVPCSLQEREDITTFWRGILNSHIDLLNFDWFDMYNAVEKDKSRLKYYIPDSFFYAFIDEWLTHPKRSTAVDDKQLYKYLFDGVKSPTVVARKVGDNFFDSDFNQIGIEEFINICTVEKEVVVKASISSYGGHAVKFWDSTKETPEQLLAYISKPPYFYTQPYGTEYVVERVIKQHPVMASFNPSSINTIRVMTLIWEGKCIPLSSVLRMGVNGSRVDNCSSGGIVAGINQSDGSVKNVAYNANGYRFETHPQTGNFGGIVIPSWDKVLKVVEKLAWRFSGISQLISWDVAIDDDGEPVVIEMNISYGELDFHQYCNGPIFGDLTPEILKKFKYKSYSYNAFIGNIGIF